MKVRLRLLLPPLSGLNAGSVLPFAVVDRQLRVLRSGELPLRELAAAVPAGAPAEAILHPDDAVVARVSPPPIAARLLPAAIRASVESMVLSGAGELCIAHGARRADGTVPVAWAQRKALAAAWALLAGHGLRVEALVPLALARPAGDARAPAEVPAQALWTAAWPGWSLALPEIQPRARRHDWRPALRWTALAAAIWIGGLLAYAHQLETRVEVLQGRMRAELAQAFPDLPTGPEPLVQARAQRDALRLARGEPAGDDLMPLALAAAQSLPALASQVTRLQYGGGTLALSLREGAEAPHDPAAIRQALAARGLAYEVDAGPPQTWRLRRDLPAPAGGSRP